MKLRVAAVLLVVLSGCQTGPVPAAYKPGSILSQRQYDHDQCKIGSLKDIPQSMATEENGGYYNPGSVQCNTIGNSTTCNRIGQVNIPATSQTYDQNGGLRDRFMARCMSAKGYSIVPRPICKTEAERAAAINDPQPGSPEQFKCSAGVALDG